MMKRQQPLPSTGSMSLHRRRLLFSYSFWLHSSGQTGHSGLDRAVMAFGAYCSAATSIIYCQGPCCFSVELELASSLLHRFYGGK